MVFGSLFAACVDSNFWFTAYFIIYNFIHHHIVAKKIA